MEYKVLKARKYLRREADILSREAYDFYRQERFHCAKGIDQYNYFVKSVSGIFSIIKEMMLNSKGGVYIEGLGYFCFVKYKNKRRYGKGLIKRKKALYFPYFFPDSKLKEWTMSDAFNFDIHLLKAGKEYNLYFNLCDSYIKARTEANRNSR